LREQILNLECVLGVLDEDAPSELTGRYARDSRELTEPLDEVLGELRISIQASNRDPGAAGESADLADGVPGHPHRSSCRAARHEDPLP
jgi:hypothetical protein